MIMLEDGVKQNNADEKVKVKDLAELVADVTFLREILAALLVLIISPGGIVFALL